MIALKYNNHLIDYRFGKRLRSSGTCNHVVLLVVASVPKEISTFTLKV
jgi:hypothetical protein